MKIGSHSVHSVHTNYFPCLPLTLAATAKKTVYMCTYIANAHVVAATLSTGSGETGAVEGIALAMRKVGARAASQPPLPQHQSYQNGRNEEFLILQSNFADL